VRHYEPRGFGKFWYPGRSGVGRAQMDKARDADARKTRRSIAARRTLLGAAILMAASRAALAAPVTLVCTGGLGPLTLDLNEAAHTVTMNFPAKPVPETTPPTLIPASSTGPMAAKFDSKMITFVSPVGGGGTVYENWTLDRLTGVLMEYRGVNAPYDRATLRNAWSRNCHVGKAKF